MNAKQKMLRRFACASFWVFLYSPLCVNAATIYVRESNAGSASPYASWETAAGNLQDALAQATDGDEIWVAEGTYYPDVGLAQTIGDRSATFLLKDGVKLYGGFPNDGSIDHLDERDRALNVTVLSGDLGKNDQAGFIGYDENAYHVLVAEAGVTPDSLLDGFVITGGNADGSGSDNVGGGLYCYEGSPTISNCDFIENRATVHGGALYNYMNSFPRIESCSFKGNQTLGDGGAMANVFCSANVLNSVFSGNSAARSGGAIANSAGFSTLINCTLAGNAAGEAGGAVYSNAGSSTFINCIIWDNSANGDTTSPSSPVFDDTNDPPSYSYCLVQNNTKEYLDSGYGSSNLDGTKGYSTPDFVIEVDPALAPTVSGDLRLQTASWAIDRGTNEARFYHSDVPSEVMNLCCDLDGNDRIRNGLVDLGAYESANEGPRLLRMDAGVSSPVSATSLEFSVTFTEAVTGFSAFEDLAISLTGTATVGSGSVEMLEGDTYKVTLGGLNGEGTVALGIKSPAKITDAEGNALTLSIPSGSVTIFQQPEVSGIVHLGDIPSRDDTLLFTVTFSEPVENFDEFSDLKITTTGQTSVARGTVVDSGDQTEYKVELQGVSGDGSVSLSINPGSGVTDTSGHALAGSLESDIVMVDQTAPVIEITGDLELFLKMDEDWVDPGAVAEDATDGAVEVEVTQGSVDTSVRGTYIIRYVASDSAGNVATATRLVLVGELSPFQQWARDEGIELILLLEDDDDSSSSLSYLERFAFGLDSTSGGGALEYIDGVLVSIGTPVLSLQDGPESKALSYLYLRRVDAQQIGLRYVARISDDASSWDAETSAGEQIVATENGLELVRISMPLQRTFIQLQIVQGE